MTSEFEDIKSQQIYQKNVAVARNSMGYRFNELDWDLIRHRRDCCSKIEQQNPWTFDGEKVFALPRFLPSTDKIADHYAELNKGLELGGGIEQYLDVHSKDPHLLQPLLQLRSAVESTDFDPNEQTTTNINFTPYFLVVFGTGDGKSLKAIIDRYKPFHIVIALSDWNDYATSFWKFDWSELYEDQESNSKNDIGCYDNNSHNGFFIV